MIIAGHLLVYDGKRSCKLLRLGLVAGVEALQGVGSDAKSEGMSLSRHVSTSL
jgi:hypothetical protein